MGRWSVNCFEKEATTHIKKHSHMQTKAINSGKDTIERELLLHRQIDVCISHLQSIMLLVSSCECDPLVVLLCGVAVSVPGHVCARSSVGLCDCFVQGDSQFQC